MAKSRFAIEGHVVPRRLEAANIPEVGVRGALYALLVLTLRGILLWIVLPATCLLWIMTAPFRLLMKSDSRPALRQYLSWADEVLIAILERTLLLPLRVLAPWPRWPRQRDTTQAPSLLDLW